MTVGNDLETRLAAVEADLAIKRTQARYAAFADAKYGADRQRVGDAAMAEAAVGQASCFTLDARWAGGEFGGEIIGRAALAEWFARPPWHFALHYYIAPEIEVADAQAQARWRLWQVGIREGENQPVMLAAITRQRLARQTDGSWLIAAMHFEQIQIFPFSDGSLPVPSTTEFSR